MDSLVFAPMIALAGVAAGILAKFIAARFDRLINRERDHYETRISTHGSLDSDALRKLAADLSRERTSAGGLQALEVRLAELESGQETDQREFAVQREYHALGLAQSKVSFTLGYVFGALGAVVVLAGAVKALFFADTGSRQPSASSRRRPESSPRHLQDFSSSRPAGRRGPWPRTSTGDVPTATSPRRSTSPRRCRIERWATGSRLCSR